MKLKKLLCTLSGDDWGIIKECSQKRQRSFTWIGLFVLIIFGLCFASSFFTFTQLFQSYWTGIPAGLFFAFMITNIYLLLLYTLTKNVIPHVKSRTSRTFAVAARLIFICFIAVVVSKPLEVALFSEEVDKEISDFKQQQFSRYRVVTEEYFQREIAEIQNSIDQELWRNNGATSPSITNERLLIQNRESEKIHLVGRMDTLVNKSNYYIEGVVLLNQKYPLCWLITFLVMAIFVTPAYLKNLMPASARFYEHKRRNEVGLIERSYAAFKERYAAMFRNLHNAKLDFIELFEDPPFNTVPKADLREFEPQDVLLREIYNA